MKRYIVITVGSILFFCLLVSGQGITGQAIERKCIRIKDAMGRSVEVGLPVKRMVVLTSDALEVIRVLNAEDLVVGVNTGIARDPLFWPVLKDKPAVGRWMEPNYELIVDLHPDIVVSYARHPAQDMERKLSPFGITVLRLDFYKIRTLLKEVEILGRILEREKEAGQLTGWYLKKMNFMQKRLKDINDRPDVYVESYSKHQTTGPGSGGHEICVLAGGYNIASKFSIPYPQITPEWVLANNPHVIIKATSLSNCYAMSHPDPLKSIRNEIMSRPAWDNIRALQDDKVYVMASDIWTGPRAIIGTSYMAKWFHPDIFRNFDPEKLHKEYLATFQGIKYQGVYVYP